MVVCLLSPPPNPGGATRPWQPPRAIPHTPPSFPGARAVLLLADTRRRLRGDRRPLRRPDRRWGQRLPWERWGGWGGDQPAVFVQSSAFLETGDWRLVLKKDPAPPPPAQHPPLSFKLTPPFSGHPSYLPPPPPQEDVAPLINLS